MAYTHEKVQYRVGTTTGTIGDSNLGVLLSGTASYKAGSFAPAYIPHIVRAVSAVITTAVTSGAVFKFIKGNIGLTGSLTTVAIVRLTTAHTKNKVVYKDSLNVEVSPGEELRVKLTDAGVGSAMPHIWVEPRWERPGNDTNMVLTT